MAKPSAASKVIAQLESDKRELHEKIGIINFAIERLKLAQPAKPKAVRKAKPAAEGSAT